LLASLKGHQLFGRFDYDLSDSVHAYVQASGNIKTNSNYSDYLTLNKVTINSQNAFLNPTYRGQLAAAGQATFALSEFVASAPRLAAKSKSDQRIYTAGLDGDLGAYKWGVDFTHGKTELRTTLVTNINNQRLAAALDAVTDATGKIVCNVTLTNPGAGCVPLNVFGAGAASQDAINYVMQPTHYAASTTMDALSGHVEGSPFKHLGGRGQCRAVGRMAEAVLRVTQRRPAQRSRELHGHPLQLHGRLGAVDPDLRRQPQGQPDRQGSGRGVRRSAGQGRALHAGAQRQRRGALHQLRHQRRLLDLEDRLRLAGQ
jgi:hypothetical protein